MITDNNNEGMDSGVSESPFDHDPVLTQYQNETEQEKWQKGLEACRKERKSFNEEAVKSLNRYGDVRKDGYANSSMYNIYFMNTDIKLAALYAKTPKPDIKRRNDDSQDDVSRVAALILQRNLSYEMDNGHFDDTFKQVLFDNVVAGIGVSWLRLEQEEQSQPDAMHPMTGMSMPQPPTINPAAPPSKPTEDTTDTTKHTAPAEPFDSLMKDEFTSKRYAIDHFAPVPKTITLVDCHFILLK